MVRASESDISTIGRVLNDSARPLKERFRALFTLKNIGDATAINQISTCFKDQSALLKHELAYCLGQMKNPMAISILTSVLEDLSQEPMVRHEAGMCLVCMFIRSLMICFGTNEENKAYNLNRRGTGCYR